MSDDPHTPQPVGGDDLAAAVNARVAAILEDARAQAEDLQAEVEAEAARRAVEVRLDAEEDAARIRAEAQEDAADYLDNARRRVDRFAQGRIQRLTDLADDLAARAGDLQLRLDQTLAVKDQLDALVETLRVAAQDAAAEASRPPVALPGLTSDELGDVVAPRDEAPATTQEPAPDAPAPVAVPAPAPVPRPAPRPPARPLSPEAEAVRARVRDAARALPDHLSTPDRPAAPQPPARPAVPVRPPLPKDDA